jgi:DNA repair protein RecN (Recombination protein N)
VLADIRIQSLGVIDDATLELGSGLTVLTGETGAGKTMVLTALGLLMGGRADPTAVRSGADKALIEGRVRVPPSGPVAARVAEAGGELDDGELVLSRSVSSEGRSRAHVGGRSAPVGLLMALADDLVAVHGQSDQQRLLQRARQKGALDRFAGSSVSEPLDDYRDRYERLGRIEAKLTEVTTHASERAEEAELLRQGLVEIGDVEPEPGEDVALSAEAERLGHADGLRTAAAQAHECLATSDLGGDPVDVLTLIGQARQALEPQRDHDPELTGLSDRLAETSYLLADLAADLASYVDRIDSDPARLAVVQQRRADLTGLVRKYGQPPVGTADTEPAIDHVLVWADRASTRLLELDNDDDRVAELQGERERLRGELAGLAATITEARESAGKEFAAAVGAELTALAMPHARVDVRVTQRPDPDGVDINGKPVAYGPDGVDEVELLFAAHAGADPRPLDRGASGGELSRLMLAIEVVFAGADPVPTFVFDEVDAGVGGAAAVEVGRRLARLARTAQVLVVTHLPQVAAFADRHLRVVKSDDGRITSSGVVALDPEARIGELSRMLAGLEGSATAKAHAIELLATAAEAKSG